MLLQQLMIVDENTGEIYIHSAKLIVWHDHYDKNKFYSYTLRHEMNAKIIKIV